MLDKLIKQTAEHISYSQEELDNIKDSVNHLKGIIKYQPDFRNFFIGGSFKRHTMVKGISDIDIYYEYIGGTNPQTALSRLRECLKSSYPDSDIFHDKPSITAALKKIPVNITPYRGYPIMIPDETLKNWKTANFERLENAINNLTHESSNYIKLIKVLKLWKYSHSREIKNYEIEEKVSKMLLGSYSGKGPLSNKMLDFFFINNFRKDHEKFKKIFLAHLPENQLKTEWLNFIENR